jgi:uncharacterized protein YjdB
MVTYKSQYSPKHLAPCTNSPKEGMLSGRNARLSALAVTAGLAFALSTMVAPTLAMASDTDSATTDAVKTSAPATTSQPMTQLQTTEPPATQQSTPAESSNSATTTEGQSNQIGSPDKVESQDIPNTQTSPEDNSTGSTSTDLSETSAPTDTTDSNSTSQDIGEGQSRESMPSVRYQAHVQDKGWQEEVSSDPNQPTPATAGTTGESKRVEAVRISIVDSNGAEISNAVEYKAHIAYQGWDKTWSRDGETAGTTGKSRAIEALRIRLLDQYAQFYDIFYRVHIQDRGWLDWTCNGDAAGSVGLGKRIEALQILLKLKGASDSPATGDNSFVDNAGISIASHVQDIGWQNATATNGQTSGTTGVGKRIEAISATIGSGYDIDGGIQYRTYLQNSGWGNWVANGAVSGTTGRGLRVEAVQFCLQGDIAKQYDLYYRVHVANYGWLDWVLGGVERNSISGTTDLSKRIEAIQLYMCRKTAASKPSTGIGYVSAAGVSYSGQESSGEWSNASNGGVAGSTGKSMPIIAMRASLDAGTNSFSGDISYQVHLANVGWVGAQSDGSDAGNSSVANSIQGIRISLGGTLARFFDVYYRVHTHNIGWLDWALDGASAGTSGLDLSAEAFEITLVPKGNNAPGSTAFAFVDESSYYGQITATMNSAQACVRNSAFSTPATPGGYCALWVSNVVANAGYGYYSGDACDLYRWYCHSSDPKQLKIGMIIAVSSHPHTRAGSVYGHVGIYIGDGFIRDSVYGYVRQIAVKDWLAYYGVTVTPRWGWLGDKRLA